MVCKVHLPVFFAKKKKASISSIHACEDKKIAVLSNAIVSFAFVKSMILASVDIGTKNFALGLFKFHGHVRPIEIITLQLFSTFGSKKRATWEQRVDNLSHFIIDQLNHTTTQFPGSPVHAVIEQQLPRAHANGRIASATQATILTWCTTMNIPDPHIQFLHPLGKFPHGLPADFPTNTRGGAPHAALKSFSKQICRQHLESYGYNDWVRHIFETHADKSDDLCDVTLQALSYAKSISKEYEQSFIQPPIPFVKPRRATRPATVSTGTKKRQKRQQQDLPLLDSMYEDVDEDVYEDIAC